PDLQQCVGDFGTGNLCDGGADQKPGEGPCPVARREPMGQIHDHARKEARLRQPQQKPGKIELDRRLHCGSESRHDSPGDQDAANPFARTPTLHQQRAWNLQQEIAPKEKAHAEANDRAVKARKSLGHRQFGNRHVGPVYIGDYVTKEEQRQQPPVGLAASAIQSPRVRGLLANDLIWCWQNVSSLWWTDSILSLKL